MSEDQAFVPKVTLRAQAARRLMELQPREPNEADLAMRRAEELRGEPEPQGVDLSGAGSWTVYAAKASGLVSHGAALSHGAVLSHYQAGLVIREQLNGDVHVVITSRDAASALFKRLSAMVRGRVVAFTTANAAVDGWMRANPAWFSRLEKRSYRMPRRRARKPAPPWRRRRRR